METFVDYSCTTGRSDDNRQVWMVNNRK